MSYKIVNRDPEPQTDDEAPQLSIGWQIFFSLIALALAAVAAAYVL